MSTYILILSFIVTAIWGFLFGRFFPVDQVLRNVQNDAARLVLDRLIRGEWLCHDATAHNIVLERRHGREKMTIVRTGGVDIVPGDVAVLEVLTNNPYEDLSLGRRNLNEILQVHVCGKRRVEQKAPSA